MHWGMYMCTQYVQRRVYMGTYIYTPIYIHYIYILYIYIECIDTERTLLDIVAGTSSELCGCDQALLYQHCVSVCGCPVVCTVLVCKCARMCWSGRCLWQRLLQDGIHSLGVLFRSRLCRDDAGLCRSPSSLGLGFGDGHVVIFWLLL